MMGDSEHERRPLLGNGTRSRQGHGHSDGLNNLSNEMRKDGSGKFDAADAGDGPVIQSGEQSKHGDGGHSDTQGHKYGYTFRRCLVIPMIILYCMAGGIYMIILPQYTQQRMRDLHSETSGKDFNACHANKSDPVYDVFIKVQQDSAKWSMIFSLCSLIPATFGNLAWPSYSDVIGRKMVFFITFIGSLVRNTLIVFVVRFELSLYYLLIGQVIDGFLGSFITMIASIFSFVCDITRPGSKRTVSIVMFELILGLTFSLSSFGTGYFIEYAGFYWPLVLSLGFTLIGMLSVFLIPETRYKPPSKPDKLQELDSQEQSPEQSRFKEFLSSILEAFKFYFSGECKVRRTKYILLILGFLFLTIPVLNRGTMETLYQLGTPFCWSSREIGLFSALKLLVAAIFGVGGAYLMQKCMAQDTIATLCTVVGIASFVVEGLAKTPLVLYTVPLLASPTGLPIPMIRSIMSTLTPPEKQGALFASIGAVENMCALIGSLSNNIIYSATISVMEGFVFLIMAVFSLIGSIFLMAYMVVARRSKQEPLVSTEIKVTC